MRISKSRAERRSDRDTRIPSSGSTPRSTGENQPRCSSASQRHRHREEAEAVGGDEGARLEVGADRDEVVLGVPRRAGREPPRRRSGGDRHVCNARPQPMAFRARHTADPIPASRRRNHMRRTTTLTALAALAVAAPRPGRGTRPGGRDLRRQGGDDRRPAQAGRVHDRPGRRDAGRRRHRRVRRRATTSTARAATTRSAASRGARRPGRWRGRRPAVRRPRRGLLRPTTTTSATCSRPGRATTTSTSATTRSPRTSSSWTSASGTRSPTPTPPARSSSTSPPAPRPARAPTRSPPITYGGGDRGIGVRRHASPGTPARDWIAAGGGDDTVDGRGRRRPDRRRTT